MIVSVKGAAGRVERVQRRNDDRRARSRTVGAGLLVSRITGDFSQVAVGDRWTMVSVRWRMKITRSIGRQRHTFVTWKDEGEIVDRSNEFVDLRVSMCDDGGFVSRK